MSLWTSVANVFKKRPPLDVAASAFAGSTHKEEPKATETAGGPGYSIHGGFLTGGERNPKLASTRRFHTYEEQLRNVAIIGLSILYFLDLVASAGWNWTPAEVPGMESQAQEYADKVKKILTGMTTPWIRVVRRFALAKFFGFGIHEWTSFKNKDEGYQAIRDVEVRPCHTIWRWDVDDSGTVQGVWQLMPQSYVEVYLPRWKVVYLVDDAVTDMPDGLGLMRLVQRDAERLIRYEQLEGYGFETDLRGNPVGRAPLADMLTQLNNKKLTEEQVRALEKPITDFVENHFVRPDRGIVLDSSTYRNADATGAVSQVKKWDLELVKGGNTTQEAANIAIERLQRQIARVFGTEHIVMGGDRGTQALSKDKTQLLTMRVDGCLADVAAAVDSDLVEAIFDLNGWDKKLKPKSQPDAVKFRDAQDAAQVVLTMAQAGATVLPGDPVVDAVRELAHLPKVPEQVARQMEVDAQLRRGAQQAAIDRVQRGPGGAPGGPQNGGQRGKNEDKGAAPTAGAPQPGKE
jgi:hypothetical protein